MKTDRTAIRPEIRRAFKGVRISRKALQEAQYLVDRTKERNANNLWRHLRDMRETMAAEERLTQYNAGYIKACSDLFGLRGGTWMHEFAVCGHRIVNDRSGRLHLDKPDKVSESDNLTGSDKLS